MQIRPAVKEDLDEILATYAFAREYMKLTGNPNQWGDSRPDPAVVAEDIRLQKNYVVEEDGVIVGVFVFLPGIDPTYLVIEGGQWLNEEPYAVIHRIAGNGKVSGLLTEVLKFCRGRTSNLRIDTHEDNKVMQHLLEKNGFTKCGIIYLENGDPRIAYHIKWEK